MGTRPISNENVPKLWFYNVPMKAAVPNPSHERLCLLSKRMHGYYADCAFLKRQEKCVVMPDIPPSVRALSEVGVSPIRTSVSPKSTCFRARCMCFKTVIQITGIQPIQLYT